MIPEKSKSASVDFHDFHPKALDFLAEVSHGLQRKQKTISSKFFYDETGSKLFSKITQLKEYYLTRTETSMLKNFGPHIRKNLARGNVVIEYGSGSSEKVHILLDHLEDPRTYLGIDISKEHLLEMTQNLATSYPQLEVIAVCADFTTPLDLPLNDSYQENKKTAFFPGSSIGNFEPKDAIQFLHTIAEEVGSRGALLIGVDLKKDSEILQSAYNDAQGLTAQFNKNLLVRMNREFHSNFDLNTFEHQAFYNGDEGRIEMHLVSLMNQTVNLKDTPIHFKKGESIHTENSYKFSIPEFQELASQAGWHPRQVWTDPDQLFSIHYLETK